MSVRLTKIYTKTGDDGTTGLADFSRIPKTHPRITAYADADETNAALGVAVALGNLDQKLVEVIQQLQNDLFDVGADLSTPIAEDPKYPPLRINQDYITRLEGWIDEFNTELEPLKSFILRGGTPAAALLHQACTISRRAERSTWGLLEVDADNTHALPATYLNRLSDLLFVLSRFTNKGGNEILWKPGGGFDHDKTSDS